MSRSILSIVTILISIAVLILASCTAASAVPTLFSGKDPPTTPASSRYAVHLPARTAGQELVDDQQITISSPTDVSNKRQELIRFIWGPAGFPRGKLPSSVTIDVCSSPNGYQRPADDVCGFSNNLNNLMRVDEIRIGMDAGQEGLAYHFVPVKAKDQLVILHHGHACTLDDSPALSDTGYGMQRTINALLYDGYSVLGMYMPHFRPDDCSGDSKMFDIPVTGGSPMKFFLEPVAVSLNYLKTKSSADNFPPYQEFHMVGFSGGGWTTTVYAAIDPAIQLSFPVAGSIPLYLRSGSSIGDLEQTLPAFYQIAGYPDLYVMGSTGPGRKQVQVLNRRDTCCYGERPDMHLADEMGMSYVQAVRDYEVRVRLAVTDLGSGSFRLEIDEAAPDHLVSHNTILNVILAELNHSRRTIGAAAGTDAFVRGMNGNLWHRGPDGWEDTGFAMVGAPAVLQGTGDKFDVFFRDPGNLIKHAFRTGSGWTIEDMPGGTVITDPVAVSWGPGRFDVAALGGDDKLYHWWWSSGSAIHLEQVSSAMGLGPPALSALGPDRLDIFFRGWDQAVYHLSSNGSAPWAFEDLAKGVISGFPTAGAAGENTLRVYVRRGSSQLWEALGHTDDDFWLWASLSALTGSTETRLSGSPSASVQGEVVKVYVRTSSGNLASFSISGDVWRFSNHGSTISGSPTATPGGAFARGMNGDLWLFDGTRWISLGGDFD